MDERTLQAALRDLPLGGLHYFRSIGSTNDEALAWATENAPDFSLVVADEQTAGRGRAGRKWFTPPESALAFSLILRPTADEHPHLTRTVGLAALALTESLRTRFLAAQIKWPNDVLIASRKVAGILIESVWDGEEVDCIVIGMGVNIAKSSIPTRHKLNFPATSLEESLGKLPNREEILHDILSALIVWRPRLGTDKLLK
ncbi:MAG TPA: biotin--[acetyl-CoA-carboxylase] ligase, partial [Anaerolineales bacterium]|nr:biotin--[acetyl-CoA-carboxylase] ligase [Anaerolineales bacterium]